MGRLPRQILLSYLPKASTLVALVFIVKVLTNTLSVADYGSYCLIQAIASYLLFLAGMGVHRYLGRSVPGTRERKQYALLARGLTIEVLVYGGLLVLIAVFLTPLSQLFKLEDYKSVLFWFLCGGVLYLSYNEMLRFLGFQKRFEVKCILSAFEKPLLLAVLLGVLLIKGSLSIPGIFASILAVFAVLFLLSSRFLKRPHAQDLHPTQLLLGARSMAMALPAYFLIDVVMKTRDVLPRYLLSATSADNTAVGFYALCDNLVRLPYGLTASVIFVLYPYIAERFYGRGEGGAGRGAGKFRPLLRTSYGLFLYAYLGLACLVIFYGRELIPLLSRTSYLEAAGLLPYFVANYLLMGFLGISHPILILDRDVNRWWLWYCGFGVLTIAAAYGFIRWLGLAGAVLSLLVTNFAMAVFTVVLLKRHLRSLLSWKGALRLAGFAAVVVGLTFAIRQWMPGPALWRLGMTALVIFGLFCLMRRGDLRLLLRPQAASTEEGEP